MEPDLETVISKIKPQKKDYIAISIIASSFLCVSFISFFDIFGSYSTYAAIASCFFAASWFGRLAENIRISKKITKIMKEYKNT